MEYAEIKKVNVAKNIDGEQPTRMLSVEIYGDDEQSVEISRNVGIDYVPVKGSRIYFDLVSQEFGVTIIADDGTTVDSTLEEGERVTYAIDGDKRVATIRQQKDDTIILTGGKDKAIKGDTFKKNYDKHQHPTAFGLSGPPSVGILDTDMNGKVLL